MGGSGRRGARPKRGARAGGARDGREGEERATQVGCTTGESKEKASGAGWGARRAGARSEFASGAGWGVRQEKAHSVICSINGAYSLFFCSAAHSLVCSVVSQEDTHQPCIGSQTGAKWCGTVVWKTFSYLLAHDK
jgi:hypothetical protein